MTRIPLKNADSESVIFPPIINIYLQLYILDIFLSNVLIIVIRSAQDQTIFNYSPRQSESRKLVFFFLYLSLFSLLCIFPRNLSFYLWLGFIIRTRREFITIRRDPLPILLNKLGLLFAFLFVFCFFFFKRRAFYHRISRDKIDY